MKIVKDLVPSSKYAIKCPYTMKPTRIVVHNTANDAPAKNEISYMKNNNNKVSFHYAVDDVEVVQGIPENRNSFNAGDGSGKGNREGIAIEICYSLSGGSKFVKAEQNAVELIVDILKRYGWGIDKVTKHQDYNGKYCPHRTLDMGWDRFIKMIENELNEKPVATNTSTKKETSTNTSIKKGDLVSIAKGAKYYTGKTVPSWVVNKKWYVASVSGNRAVIDKSEDGKNSINSPIDVKYLKVVAKSATSTIKVGSTVKVKSGAKTYDGKNLASFVYSRKHKVKELKGNRAVITYLGITVCAIDVKNLTLV